MSTINKQSLTDLPIFTDNNVFTRGGVSDHTIINDGTIYGPNPGWQDKVIDARTMPSRMDTFIAEDSTVHIGDDFTMSAKEFKVCMKMLREMAMKECPEEFI